MNKTDFACRTFTDDECNGDTCSMCLSDTECKNNTARIRALDICNMSKEELLEALKNIQKSRQLD